MLKKRIGAALVIKDNWVVQSIGFKKYLPVGRAEIAVEYLNKWGIDEIILLDISATKNQSVVSSLLVSKAAKFSRVPLAIGGGITNVHQMEDLLQNGADKICLNNILLNDRSLLTKGARQFGDQCMVAVIDFVKDPESNQYKVYDYLSGKVRDLNVIEYSKQLEESGAGELLLQSVDRDGKYNGFENELYNQICTKVHIPVIALGGAGNAAHFDEILDKSDVSAACAGNIFHFSEHSVNILKAQLLREQHNIRLETHANYNHNKFDENNRLLKSDDQYLEDLLFIRIEKEVI